MAKKKKSVEEAEEEKGAAEEGSLSGRLGEFGSAVMQIAEEKGISKERVLEVVEAALAAAYKRDYGKRGQVIRALFDEVSKEAKFFLVKEVVDETTREFVKESEEETNNEHSTIDNKTSKAYKTSKTVDKKEGKEDLSAVALAEEDRLP